MAQLLRREGGGMRLGIGKYLSVLPSRLTKGQRNITYHVITPGKAHGLSFDTRNDARAYKRLLALSRSRLEAKIVRYESVNGFLVDREVS